MEDLFSYNLFLPLHPRWWGGRTFIEECTVNFMGPNTPSLSLLLCQHLMLTQSGGTFIEECTVATSERNFPVFPSPVCMSCSQAGRQEVGLSLRNGKYRGGCVTPSSLLPRAGCRASACPLCVTGAFIEELNFGLVVTGCLIPIPPPHCPVAVRHRQGVRGFH